MSAIVDSDPNKHKDIINPFIIIGLCALTLSIFSLLILIIYVNYQSNRITDMRNTSKQYHEIINTIIREINFENDFKGYKEVLDGKNLIIDGEYDIYVPSVEVYDNSVKSFKKKLYEAGIGVNTVEEKEKIPYLLVKVNGVKIAKINIKIKTSQEKNKNEILEKDEKIFSLVRSLLLSKYISTTELMESLPEPVSDGNNIWFHKKMALFLPADVNDNAMLTDIKKLISEKFSSSDIKTNVDNKKNTIEHNIYIDGKHLLTISIQKFSDGLNRETTSSIETSLSTRFPIENYIEKHIPTVLFSIATQHIQENQNYIEKESTYTDTMTNQENKQKPKIAIILDDGGYRDPAEDPALDLPNKINISILPDTRYTKELAKKAEQKGFEIMLHMPMQTKQGIKKGSFLSELLITMSEEEIKKQTEYALEQIAGVKGVNNHTGGVFTLKEEPLKSFMKVLKKKELFFVDSVVVGGSKAYSVAKEEGVSTLQRDVFLDHEYTIPKIKESIETLKKIATKKGKAIGIGHFRDLTIQVLKEELPQLEKQGFELVHVSELFK